MFLITGGAGFIGANMTRTLVEQGQAVRIFDNFSTGRQENLEGLERSVDIVKGDLRDPPALGRAMKDVRYVLHFAAIPSVAHSVADPEFTHDVNLNGTLNLLVAAKNAQVERMVFSSSCAVYGPTTDLPARETAAPNPMSPYALHKLTGETYCRLFSELYGLKAYMLRYFNVYGPRQNLKSDYAAVIPLFIRAYLKGQPPVIYGDGGQTRDFVHVDDVVAANLTCCHAPEAAAGRVCNIACGTAMSILDLAHAIAAALGQSVMPPPVHQPARAGDIRDSYADIRQAREQLQWEPRITFADGLARTIEWYRQNL